MTRVASRVGGAGEPPLACGALVSSILYLGSLSRFRAPRHMRTPVHTCCVFWLDVTHEPPNSPGVLFLLLSGHISPSASRLCVILASPPPTAFP